MVPSVWLTLGTNRFSEKYLVSIFQLSLVAETGFSHRSTAYKIVGHFFGLSYRKISGSNQGKFFLESVTFHVHAHMLSTEVAQSLKSYGHFSDLEVGVALSHRHVIFSSIHGLGEDDTAISQCSRSLSFISVYAVSEVRSAYTVRRESTQPA